MTRQAILIDSSNVLGEADLPGARVDIANWNTFLRSPLGGGWAESEILIFRKPLSTHLEAAIKAASDKYCVVAYSGHGSDGRVALNDHRKDYPVQLLRPQGTRGTMVIDSCRGTATARELSFAEGKSASFMDKVAATEILANAREGRSVSFSASDGDVIARINSLLAKIEFGTALTGSGRGIVSMLSCGRGEAAGENSKSGGYYTSALLAAALAFDKAQGAAAILNTREAHNHAAKIMPPQQNPEYSPLTLAFPFAVRLTGRRPVI